MKSQSHVDSRIIRVIHNSCRRRDVIICIAVRLLRHHVRFRNRPWWMWKSHVVCQWFAHLIRDIAMVTKNKIAQRQNCWPFSTICWTTTMIVSCSGIQSKSHFVRMFHLLKNPRVLLHVTRHKIATHTINEKHKHSSGKHVSICSENTDCQNFWRNRGKRHSHKSNLNVTIKIARNINMKSNHKFDHHLTSFHVMNDITLNVLQNVFQWILDTSSLSSRWSSKSFHLKRSETWTSTW